MDTSGQIITVVKAIYIEDYKIFVTFSDESTQMIDFYPFLSGSTNPHIRKYLNLHEFKKFEVCEGDLIWNDYDLCFPIPDLYENTI